MRKNLFTACIVGSLIGASTFASAATINLDLDATTNISLPPNEGIAGANLISVNLLAGSYEIDVVDGLYQAFRFGDNALSCDSEGKDCGDGWLVSYNVFNSLGVALVTFRLPVDTTYDTSARALAEAQAAGSKALNILADGIYYFGVSDHIASGFDNTGGVSLRVSGNAISAVPLPATLPMLLAGIAGLGFWRRKKA